MKILVTGGLGFLGLHLVRGLAETIPGARITAADVLAASPAVLEFLAPVKDQVELVLLDVRDRPALRRLVHLREIEGIVHAAGLTPDIATEREQMEAVLDVNLGGALNAILAAQEPSVQQVLLCSSSGVYGTSGQGEARTEDAALELDGLYAITKRSAELIGERAAFLTGKRIAALRLASLYGEMERPTGSREQMSLVYRLTQALRDGKKLGLSGAEIGRDWMHAGEAAQAVAALLVAPAWSHPVYNVGSGQILTLRDLAEIFGDRGLQVTWSEDPADADIALRPENGRSALCIERLTADSGFVPADSRQVLEAFAKSFNHPISP